MSRLKARGASALAAMTLLTLACSPARSRPPVNASEIGARDSLPEWDYSDAAEAVTDPSPRLGVERPRGEFRALRLLAWRTLVTSGTRTDHALWWGNILTPDGPRWLLALGMRGAGSGAVRSNWVFAPRRNACAGRSLKAYVVFERPPTSQDVVNVFNCAATGSFLLTTNESPGAWFYPSRTTGSSVRVFQAAVRSQAWLATFGEAPPPEFQP